MTDRSVSRAKRARGQLRRSASTRKRTRAQKKRARGPTDPPALHGSEKAKLKEALRSNYPSRYPNLACVGFLAQSLRRFFEKIRKSVMEALPARLRHSGSRRGFSRAPARSPRALWSLVHRRPAGIWRRRFAGEAGQTLPISGAVPSSPSRGPAGTGLSGSSSLFPRPISQAARVLSVSSSRRPDGLVIADGLAMQHMSTWLGGHLFPTGPRDRCRSWRL
jgi:hypothetical protein